MKGMRTRLMKMEIKVEIIRIENLTNLEKVGQKVSLVAVVNSEVGNNSRNGRSKVKSDLLRSSNKVDIENYIYLFLYFWCWISIYKYLYEDQFRLTLTNLYLKFVIFCHSSFSFFFPNAALIVFLDLSPQARNQGQFCDCVFFSMTIAHFLYLIIVHFS